MAEEKHASASVEPPLFSNHHHASLLSEKDLAAAIVPDRAQPFDRVMEQRVVRKLDLYLIPWMWLGYGLVYYDKVREEGGEEDKNEMI